MTTETVDAPERSIGENPSMDHYQMLLSMQHQKTVLGGRCDGFEPAVVDKGDQVIVYCGNCGVLLHRKDRAEGSDDE